MTAGVTAWLVSKVASVDRRRAGRLSRSLYALAIAGFILHLWWDGLPLFLISIAALLTAVPLSFRELGWPESR